MFINAVLSNLGLGTPKKGHGMTPNKGTKGSKGIGTLDRDWYYYTRELGYSGEKKSVIFCWYSITERGMSIYWPPGRRCNFFFFILAFKSVTNYLYRMHIVPQQIMGPF